jgi:hypothetical protein
MNWNLFLKYMGYAGVLAIYGAFAWSGKAPVEGFIAVLTGVIAALGATHAASAAAANVVANAAPVAPVVPAPAPTTVVQS